MTYKLNFVSLNDMIWLNKFRIITSERSERSFYEQSYIGRLDDIQTALKRLKKLKKFEIHFYEHFRTS